MCSNVTICVTIGCRVGLVLPAACRQQSRSSFIRAESLDSLNPARYKHAIWGVKVHRAKCPRPPQGLFFLLDDCSQSVTTAIVTSCLLFLPGGRVKTWKRRWFILTDNCLYYFEYTTVSTEHKLQSSSNLKCTSARHRWGGRFGPRQLAFNILVCCRSAMAADVYRSLCVPAGISTVLSTLILSFRTLSLGPSSGLAALH